MVTLRAVCRPMTTVLASAGCTQSPRCITSVDDVLVYACDATIVLRREGDTAVCRPHSALDERASCSAARVTCVVAVDDGHIVSGGADGSLVVWHVDPNDIGGVERVTTIGGVHELPVSCIAALTTSSVDRQLTILSGAPDCRLSVHRVTSGGDVNVQRVADVSMDTVFPLCADMTRAGDSALLVAVGTSRDMVHVYAVSDDAEQQTTALTLLTQLRGHSDWVQTVQWHRGAAHALGYQLASTSQDHTVRIWHIAPTTAVTQAFTVADTAYTCALASVLAGHDDWVYACRWSTDGRRLVTASMDKAIIVWLFDVELDVWMEESRVGHMAGASVGFYGVVWLSSAVLVANGYTGGLHAWTLRHDVDMDEMTTERRAVMGGHASEVNDVAWSPSGAYLLSCGGDYTTRLYARCKPKDAYCELARPQVHGHAMQCLATIDERRFVSAGEEKLLRVFAVPDIFVTNFARVAVDGVRTDGLFGGTPGGVAGASLPSLGLSNKSVTRAQLDCQSYTATQRTQSTHAGDNDAQWHFDGQLLDAPPIEQHLMQNTLWPEVHKLYGHGYELYACAASYDGAIVASACKANKPEHAAIIVWSTQDWSIAQHLLAHQLTVTAMRFSHDDAYIVSVGRDRQWHVFGRANTTSSYTLVASSIKTTCHARIIWDCATTAAEYSFVTVGRDKKLMCWTLDGEHGAAGDAMTTTVVRTAVHALPASGNAVDVVAARSTHVHFIAVGMESGHIHVLRWSTVGAHVLTLVTVFDSNVAHARTVKRVAFRPRQRADDDDTVELASCSDDSFVKVYKVTLT